MVAFGSFAPTNIEPPTPKKVESRPINKIENENGQVPVKMASREEVWVHPYLINDEDWEVVKTKPISRERRKAKRQNHNSQQRGEI